jgi:hypothetical protein
MERGGQWTDKVYGKITLTIILLKLFEPQLTAMGFPMLPLYVFGALGIFILNFFIGLIDLRLGIWKHQNNVGWYYTPIAMKMVGQVNDIHASITKKN